MKTFYKLLAAAVVSLYAYAGLVGFGGDDKQAIPTSARQSPGGYRAFHFYGGFHGGK